VGYTTPSAALATGIGALSAIPLLYPDRIRLDLGTVEFHTPFR